jgi:hypothetical protein
VGGGGDSCGGGGGEKKCAMTTKEREFSKRMKSKTKCEKATQSSGKAMQMGDPPSGATR